MNILGISAFYHDSAACLIQNGQIKAAAQEERFSRIKHDHSFPIQACQYCLSAGHLRISDLDYVVFYEKPLMKFDRLMETYLSYAPAGFRSFCQAIPLWLKGKLFLHRELDRGLNKEYKKPYVFTQHHESHAASAFFPSPFQEAAIVTMDGVGEWATATIGVGSHNHIELIHELRFPHSLGLLYSAFTYYTGFKVNSGEYKLMGLAPYGEPKYVQVIKDKLIDMKADGSFRMDMSYFNYCQGLTMTSRRFHQLFGAPPRDPDEKITVFHMDIAASIQKVTEEIMLRIVNTAQQKTGKKNLCLAGGVALNCVGNGRILRESAFENVWIQPASGDAGGALGAALFVWYQLLDNPRNAKPSDSQQASLLGPSYSDEEIIEYLDQVEAAYHKIEDASQLYEQIADLLEQKMVIGWFQGRMEFGPRALGSRSILGDPRLAEMQRTMNLKIKFRESFRPFAPAILREKASDYFQIPPHQDSPYMLLVADVHPGKRLGHDGDSAQRQGFDKLTAMRSQIPAVTHVDYSARVQTVDQKRHPHFYLLLDSFQRRTGCPVLINTSFNVRGEPIVCSPGDAYRCFMATQMDVLVMGSILLLKKEQPGKNLISSQQHLNRFELD